MRGLKTPNCSNSCLCRQRAGNCLGLNNNKDSRSAFLEPKSFPKTSKQKKRENGWNGPINQTQFKIDNSRHPIVSENCCWCLQNGHLARVGQGEMIGKTLHFYQTQVRSLPCLVSHWVTMLLLNFVQIVWFVKVVKWIFLWYYMDLSTIVHGFLYSCYMVLSKLIHGFLHGCKMDFSFGKMIFCY